MNGRQLFLLQKPLENNYPNTVKKWGLGVMQTAGNGDRFQSNIFENIPRDEKENFNMHCTIKPKTLIKKLIQLTTPLEKDRVILDPFMGSGTTAIAALEQGVSYFGFEIVPEYFEITEDRINKAKNQNNLF